MSTNITCIMFLFIHLNILAPPATISSSSTESPTSTFSTHPVNTGSSSYVSETSTFSTSPVTTSISSTDTPTSTETTSTTATATTISTSTNSSTSAPTTSPVTTTISSADTPTSTPTTSTTATATTISSSTSSSTSANTTPPVTTSSSSTSTPTTSTTANTTTISSSTNSPTPALTTPPATTTNSSTSTPTTSTTANTTTISSSTHSPTPALTTSPVTTSSSSTSTPTTSTTTATTISSSTNSPTPALTTSPVTTSSSSTSTPTTSTTTATTISSSTNSPTPALTTPPVTTTNSSTSTPTTSTTANTTTISSSTNSPTPALTTSPVTTSSSSTSTPTTSTTANTTTISSSTNSPTPAPTTPPVTTSSSSTSTPTTSTTNATTIFSSTSSSTPAPTTPPVTTSSSSTSTPTTSTKPEVIRDLTVNDVKSTSVFLKWAEPIGYRSYFTVDWNQVSRAPKTTNETFYHITDLKPEVNYTFCVTAVIEDPRRQSEPFCISELTKSDKTGLIVGIVVPLILILLIIALILFFYSRRQTKKQCPDIPVHNISNSGLKIEDYEEYFKRKHADSNCGFAEDYEELKSVGTAQSKNAALSIENKAKNRYTNVLPYDSSRVRLSMCGNPFDDYINANYIPGYNSRKEFIAAQGPLPVTVNEFWRMMWEKNVYTIVMLTKCNEQGRVKCEKYWPSETHHYHNISVTTTSDIPLDSWTIRDFRIKNMKTAETRYVRQFHFTAWPDHGVPETTEVLIDFRHLVREHMDQYSRHSPTVVHCSAGVGRTGTFIAIDQLIFQIERESTVDIYGIVNDMRMHRALMVQTEEQYVYLHQCAHDIIRARTGTNVDLIYQNNEALNIYQNAFPSVRAPRLQLYASGYGTLWTAILSLHHLSLEDAAEPNQTQTDPFSIRDEVIRIRLDLLPRFYLRGVKLQQSVYGIRCSRPLFKFSQPRRSVFGAVEDILPYFSSSETAE
ncbi:unnamed protein product [Leuciscus chuanchicus]